MRMTGDPTTNLSPETIRHLVNRSDAEAMRSDSEPYSDNIYPEGWFWRYCLPFVALSVVVIVIVQVVVK